MRCFAFSWVTMVVVALACEARAAELKYKWTAGTTYRFSAASHDVISMSAMGMGQNLDLTTSSVFSVKVNKVTPNGTAQGTLAIESFAVKDAEGHALAGLDGIPKDAIKSLVEIDAKGNFQFKEVVYLVVDEQGENLLVSGKAGPGSVSASAQAGDEKVSVYASFDPKSGKLSGGYTVEKIAKQPKRKQVAVTQDKPKIDVLPVQFLELLKLPDGDVTAGGKSSIGLSQSQMQSSTDMTVEVKELTPARAKLRLLVASKNAAQVPVTEEAGERAADAAEDDAMGAGGEDGMPGMGMMGMPGMGGMTGGGGAPAAGGQLDMSMKIDGDILLDFDVKAGMLSELSGVLATETGAAGMMKINSRSDLKLKRL